MTSVLKRIVANRSLQRLVFRILRRLKPVLRIGKRVFVTRHDQVVDVLERSEDFSVLPIYEEKMRHTSGDFFLGMDDTSQYREESRIVRKAIVPSDLVRIQGLARGAANHAVANARSNGRMEVVETLTRQVPLRLCDEFFGVPGPDSTTLKEWMRVIFHHLFLNLNDDKTIRDRAEELSHGLRSHLEEEIQRVKEALQSGADDPKDTFLSRLVRVQASEEPTLTDEAIRRNVAGVVIGSVDTVSKAAIHALSELLSRPRELAGCHRAAMTGDTERVSAYIFEALRFYPHNPIILRATSHEARLTMRPGKYKSIPAGCKVYAVTYSAMFDPRHYPNPREFVVERDDRSHLQFGAGLHRCFGERLNHVVLPEILTPLLALKGLRRASGKDGRIEWDGPFPNRLTLEFTPEAS